MKYTKSHEWVKVEEEGATVGITDHAQKELGDIVYVELPRVGYKVKANEVIAVLESTKAAIDLYSPLTGEVLEINLALKESPHKINQSPEQEGWIYKLKIENPDETKKLFNEKDYRAFLANEAL